MNHPLLINKKGKLVKKTKFPYQFQVDNYAIFNIRGLEALQIINVGTK